MRTATEQETKGMMAAYLAYTELKPEDVASFDAYVRDKYISDCPGYAGPVGFFHWHGAPHLLTIFIWRRREAPMGEGWTLIAETNDLNLVGA